MFLPSCQVHDAGELTGPSSASVLVMPHVLVNPQHPNPCETGGVIRCCLQARLDVGPHGVPCGCQLSGQASDGGSLEAQLSDRPADRPHTQTRPGCAHPLVMFQECHRLADMFATYPSALKPPDPRRDPGRARRSPPPPYDRGLERFSPQPGQPAQRSLDSMSSIRVSGVRATLIALQADEQITPITTIKRRRAAAGRVRHRPRSFEDRGG